MAQVAKIIFNATVIERIVNSIVDMYSGTSLIRTPIRQKKLSLLDYETTTTVHRKNEEFCHHSPIYTSTLWTIFRRSARHGLEQRQFFHFPI